ncbi:MAG TPA: hypothetical protein VFT42_00505 [Solirubrobacteraceae bacterium]|nr:hypothetical protein [Solirubrobacteraceae bacterium]
MRRFALPLLLAASLLAPAAARAETGDIAKLDRNTPIAAYGGRLLWSAYVDATKQYVLTTRANGITSVVPVAPRSVPFDADLGPDAQGHVVAVYSRCTREITPSGSFAPSLYNRGKGCDLYEYDFTTARETKLAGANAPAASEFWPTIWKGTLAFGRTYDRKPDYPYIYTRPVTGAARSARQPGGARNQCSRGQCSNPTLSRPEDLDLYGRRLGFTWRYSGVGEGLSTDIRMDTIGGGHTRVAHQGGGGLTQVELGWPAFEAGRLEFSRGCFGDPGGCPGRFGLSSYRISTRQTQTAPTGTEAILSHDRDGGVTYLLIDTQPGTDCMGDPAVPGGTCVLRGVQPAFS